MDDVAQNNYDAVVLPGGLGGAKALAASAKVGEILKRQYDEGRLCAAICAGPTAFQSHKIGTGKQLTSYPSVKDQLTDYKYIDDQKVVQDGNLITSRGPATAFDFALKISESLVGTEVTKKAAQQMLFDAY